MGRLHWRVSALVLRWKGGRPLDSSILDPFLLFLARACVFSLFNFFHICAGMSS